MAAAGYVGIEPEAAGWLAGAAERGSEEVGGTARRVAALFAEVGEYDTVSSGLRELESWLNGQAADVRRRAAAAAVAPVAGADPTCQVPWTDPLVRAAKSVWHNAVNFSRGAATSVGETATMVWQLVPVNDGWGQAWVDLGSGVVGIARDPLGAVTAAVDFETLNDEGLSYWIGGFAPDIVGLFVGGAGVAKGAARAGGKVADAAHAVRAGRRLTDAAQRLPRRRRHATAGPTGQAAGPPRRDWRLERAARANVRAEDGQATASPSARGAGHSATLHGRRTSLRQQLVRTATGVKPDGAVGYPVSGSRFFRWQDQDEAITRAKAQWTGQPKIEIPLDHPIGEGHMKTTLEYRRTNVAIVRFDQHGNVYTSFPFLEKGWTLP